MSLLTYEEAIACLHKAVPTTAIRPIESISVDKCLGRALAEPIYAAEANPRFDNSAVDGYAISCAEDAISGKNLQLAGEARAGGQSAPTVTQGNAVRVLTGAPVPQGTYAIVMQEDAVREGRAITLNAEAKQTQHIRTKAADFAAGDQLLSPGATLNPGHVSLLASQGITEVRVFERVNVTVLATGDELVDASEQPGDGQLRDSNSPMLRALLERDPHIVVATSRVGDTLEATVDGLKAASDGSELILVSGGASVGDYDFLRTAVEQLGTVLFHGVSVRPGKPILAGRIGNALIFGLPGNPASVFVGYHIFVRDTLRRLGGHAESSVRWVPVLYEAGTPHSRDDFVRCRITFDGGKLLAKPVSVQGSFGLRSLADAQALVRVPAGATGLLDYSALLL